MPIVPPAAAESLLRFPAISIIMGRTQDGFAQAVVAVVRRHAPTRPCDGDRARQHLSVTATIHAGLARAARRSVPRPRRIRWWRWW
jgi:putative lipoic acid-binding regulatory protein